jgi:hypothetical protein
MRLPRAGEENLTQSARFEALANKIYQLLFTGFLNDPVRDSLKTACCCPKFVQSHVHRHKDDEFPSAHTPRKSSKND